MADQSQRITQSEVKQITGLTRAKLRYWKQALSDLQGKGGRKPCFTPDEAFALRVLAWLIDNLRCEVAVLEYASSRLFSAARGGAWLRLEHQFMVLWPTEKRVRFQFKSEERVDEAPDLAIVVDLAPHVQAVKNYLLGLPEEPRVQQESLPFGPARLKERQVASTRARTQEGR
jgi:hypothetical protein